MADPIQHAHETISAYMEHIASLFIPGALVTVIVRNPSFPDGSANLVVTTDELPDAMAALQQSQG